MTAATKLDLELCGFEALEQDCDHSAGITDLIAADDGDPVVAFAEASCNTGAVRPDV